MTDGRMLAWYAERLSTVEINATLFLYFTHEESGSGRPLARRLRALAGRDAAPA